MTAAEALPPSLLVHATAVAIRDLGADAPAALLRGPSGCGKSDLALRLIDAGGILIADDQTRLILDAGLVVATVPPAIAGLIELRGIGLVPVPYRARAVVAVVFDLVPGLVLERMPEPETERFFGITLPLIRLDPFTASAAAKVRLAVSLAWRDKLDRS